MKKRNTDPIGGVIAVLLFDCFIIWGLFLAPASVAI